jgi:hypothetical protein
MTRGSNGYKRTADGGRVPYAAYVCSDRCTAPAKISLPATDAFVLGRVLEHLAASDAAGAPRGSRDRIGDAERELDAAEAELDAYLAAVSAADVGAAAFARAARERRERVDEARHALADAASWAHGPSHDDLISRLPDMDDLERNAILRTLVDHVVIAKAGRQLGPVSNASDRVLVVMRGDDQAEGTFGVREDVQRERAAAA